MMLKYKNKDEALAGRLPGDKEMRQRGTLGLTSSTHKGFLTVTDLKSKLESYGPIWISGEYCGGKKHIIVVRGVRDPWVGDPEVYINDPWSGFRYSLNNPRWISFKTFAGKINPVSFACQHWM